MEEINNRFRQYRISLNITQEKLSQISGVSVYTIKKFENGSDIKMKTFAKLLSALDINNAINEIIPDVTERPSYKAKYETGQTRKRAHNTKTEMEWKWGE